ncbi:MAG: hypothetical protein QXZ51_05645 [Candidatus Bathyarchaeia archaeon]
MVIKWYHVFGSGSGMVYFRPTRADFKPFRDFFAAAKSAATDDGHNGFVGTYSCPNKIGEEFGWDSLAVFWPPANDDYRPESGWHPANFWLRTEKDLEEGIRVSFTFKENEDGNWGTWPDIIYMTEEIQLQIQPLTKDLEKELVARFLAIQEYRALQRRLPK